jgi:hypothetical protein
LADTSSLTEQGDRRLYKNGEFKFSFIFSKDFQIVQDSVSVQSEQEYLNNTINDSKITKIYDTYPIAESEPGIFVKIIRSSRSIDDLISLETKSDENGFQTYQKNMEIPGNRINDMKPKVISIIKLANNSRKVVRLHADTYPKSQEVEYITKKGDLVYIFSSIFQRDWRYNPDSIEQPIENGKMSTNNIYRELEASFNTLKID